MLERVANMPASDAACDCGCAELRYRLPDPGPITVMMQPFEAFVAEALDAVPAAALPDVRLEGSLAEIRSGLARELARCGFAPAWLADWLVANIDFQARLFAELSGARRLRLRLETVADDGCERFHVDNVRQRLLCTYRGPGTEWLDPKIVAFAENGDAIPAEAIRRLERGAIAILRGQGGANGDRPGLFHRSPRIEGSGIVRLLLVIDEAA